MKQIVTSAIITLIIGLLIAYFAFNLNKEYVDLRYTLSEKIPTKFIETSPAETIQQLVVKNNGNIPAIKIQIKIDGFVKDHDILKNSISDVVEEHNINGHFEAIYPTLPPDAQFSYIFKTSGGDITKNNLEIKHNKGKAKEALASDNQSIYSKIGIYIFSAVIIFYIILFLFQGRSMAIDHLESSGTYKNYYDYLNKKKPIYVSQEKWDSIRRKYIEGKIKAKYLHTTNIEEQENYKILSQDKPKFITNDEWELLKEKSSNCLLDQLTYSIKTSGVFDNIKIYFTLKKPKHFPENKWKEIVKEANENFITVQKLKESFYLSTKDIVKELESGSPTGMLFDFWDKYKEFLKDRYYKIIYREILREVNPLEYLEEFDLSILSKEKQEELKYLAYKIQLFRIKDISSLNLAEKFLKNDRPEWIKQDDIEKLEKKAKSYVALDKLIKKNESLSNALNNIVNFTQLKDRPKTLDSNEWDRVCELESKIATTALKIEEDKSKLESEGQKVKELKTKILKQLSIIDGIFNDPESIDKIEDYDNPFSEGNYKNLKRISKCVLELQIIT